MLDELLVNRAQQIMNHFEKNRQLKWQKDASENTRGTKTRAIFQFFIQLTWEPSFLWISGYIVKQLTLETTVWNIER